MLSGNRVLIYKESSYRPNMANTAYRRASAKGLLLGRVFADNPL